MAANGRIDVHHHVLPEFYIKAQKESRHPRHGLSRFS